jgi:uncharacterized DUF497 family protein
VIRIVELEFDDYNMEKLKFHKVEPTEVIQILENEFTVRRNKKAASGDLQLIGRTNGGRILTVIITPTSVEGRWRPITAWTSTTAERRALNA